MPHVFLRSPTMLLPGLAAVILLGAQAMQSVAGAAETEEKAKKPKTHRVETGPFRIDVTLDAVFAAEQLHPVALQPRAWQEFKIVKAVEAGTRVRQGEQLIWLESRKLDEAIEDQEAAHRLAELDLALAKEQYALLRQSQPDELQQAERARKNALEDLEDFRRVLRPHQERALEMSNKMAEQYLEYSLEELRQLEKMYKADELTEETEEIILKRARNEVEAATFRVESTRLMNAQQRKLLPRQQLTLEETARSLTKTFESERATAPLKLARAERALDKSHIEFERSATRLADLKADREAMKIVAPISGIVYYGHSERGEWSTPPTKFTPGTNLPANQILLTIVVPRPLRLHAKVPEKHLHAFREGVTGRAIPAGFPDLRIPVKVASVDYVPISAGTFPGTLTVELPESSPILPGMTAKVTLVDYQKEDALTVPADAVFAEVLEPNDHYVYLFREGKSPNYEKRPVKIGRKTEKKVEILEGLKAGDEILAEDPTQSSTQATK